MFVAPVANFEATFTGGDPTSVVDFIQYRISLPTEYFGGRPSEHLRSAFRRTREVSYLVVPTICYESVPYNGGGGVCNDLPCNGLPVIEQAVGSHGRAREGTD